MRFSNILLAICIVYSVSALPTDVDPIETTKRVFNAANSFSTAFYKNAEKNEKENLVTSPLSAYMVLGMISFGAQGKTLHELQKGLQIPTNDVTAFIGFYAITNILKAKSSIDVTLNIANKLFLAQYLTPKSKFQEILKHAFHSESQNLNFANSINAAQEINKWVSQETHHRIDEAVDPAELSASTAMMIVNTIYFNGSWSVPFDALETETEAFIVDKNTYKRVPMMHQSGDYIHGRVRDLPADYIIIPYKNNLVTMTVVVPDGGVDLSHIEENMHLLKHENLYNTSRNSTVELSLPRFKIESTIDLQSALQKIGMGEMFTAAANFGGISDTPLQLNKVVQKVSLEVNESGTEAAAETSGSITNKIAKDAIIVNRPSLIIIRMDYVDLFVGRLVDPTLK